MKRPAILYITSDTASSSTASYINSSRRRLAMENAGYTVIPFHHMPGRFVSDCRRIFRLIRSVQAVMIRIDGSGTLDKFTVLKCLFPTVRVHWELHGFPQESYGKNLSTIWKLISLKQYIRRRLLSYLTDTVICVSEEVAEFAKMQIHMKHQYVIPNFIVPAEYQHIPRGPDTVLDTLSKRFLVCWGGSADLSWQALDTIERVAKITYRKDPSVLFVIIGSDPWHTFRWRKNILCLSRVPRREFLRLIQRADVCLALYHKPPRTPFYFAPLKILDYMALQKAVIATNQPTIRTLITHDVNGLLTTNAPADIAAKILMLKQRLAYKKRLGRYAGMTITAHHTIRQAWQGYVDILNQSSEK